MRLRLERFKRIDYVIILVAILFFLPTGYSQYFFVLFLVLFFGWGDGRDYFKRWLRWMLRD